MHDKPRGVDDDDRATTAALDLRDQGVVLTHVLAFSPALLSLAELVRELSAGSAGFPERDRFERGVADLIAAGLLLRSDELVLPTRAALRFDEILRAGA